MNKFSDFLTNALRIVILVAVGILIATSIGITTKLSGDEFTNKFFAFEVGIIIIGSIIIFSNMRHKHKIWLLLLMALGLRLFWILSINTMPVSDFQTMYENANIILSGDLSELKGYSYLARFPHLIPMTFYIAGMIKLFPIHNLIAMKLLNVVYGCVSLYLLYKLLDGFVKSERNKLFIILIGAVFPPFITYTSVLCTENIAIPLYLLTLLMFYKARNINSPKYFIIVGGILAISNLFRGVAIVFLIAFSIYLLLCTDKNKFVNIGSTILGYIIITVGISGILLKADIIERPLWNGAEPSSVTLLLKGTNFESNGMWNLDDADFIDEHLRDDDLVNQCLDKVKERILSKTPKELFIFYAKKFGSQWAVGDCSGTYWAYTGANIYIQSVLPITFQYTYMLILIFAFLTLLKKGEKNNILLNIILFGFGLLFIIIETQPRYSYIVSWIFLILATQGIEFFLDLIKKVKASGHEIKKRFN